MKKVFCFIYIFAFLFIGLLLIDNHNNKLQAYLYSYDLGDRLYILDMSYDVGIDDYYFTINKDYYNALTDDYVYRNEYDGDYEQLIAYFIKTKEYYTNVKPIQFQFSYSADDKVIFDLHFNNGQLIDYINSKFELDYNDGYSDGYNDGYTVGENDGYTVGENDGYSSGYNEGYTVGKSDGMAITYNYHQLHKVNDNIRDVLDLDNKKFYDNVGRVDLGTLTWNATSGTSGIYFEADYNTGLSVSTEIRKDIICGVYDNGNARSIYNGLIDKIITLNDNYISPAQRIYIRDNSYTTVADFKSSLSGVYLYYQLAVPEVYDLTDEEIAQFPSYKIGYRDGYKEAEGTIDGFSKIVPSVFGSIWLVVTDFLSIEIFGISLWSILLLFASLSLLILFLKLVF